MVELIDDAGTTVAEYSYNAWGEPISVVITENDVTDEENHIANVNPLRYRGYYYDAETGFYYLQSRYYDPVLKRFINADSLASTGQGFIGTNMFAYCNNNPVNFSDPAGNACVSVNDVSVDFLQWLIEQGKSFLSALAAAAGAAASDGPLPFGDAAAIGIIGSWAYKNSGTLGLFGAFGAVSPTLSSDLARGLVQEATQVQRSSTPQAFFPEDPNDFMPKGLIRQNYPGTHNGAIIKWFDPITNTPIFEWDEDFKAGAHYHTMIPIWGGKHLLSDHMNPGAPVPEPWNTVYFGG